MGRRQWCAGFPPEKLIYPLQHAYTPAELSFGALKGADAAAAAVLKGAAARSDCELHLALISIEESGIAEHTGYYGSPWRRSSDDEEEFEAVEVCDRSATLSDWLRADGAPTPLKEFHRRERSLPSGSFDDMEPDEVHFHEETGNEGASFERTYRRAALTLWPVARKLAIFNQAGLDVTLAYLGELTDRWETSGAHMDDGLWREADEQLCGYMLDSWPVHRWYPRKDDASSKESRMLLLLARLKNCPRIEAFLGSVTAAGAFASADAEAAVQAACLLPDTRAGELIERIVAGNADRALSACGRLLACAAGRVASLTGAAASLVAALPPGANRPCRRSKASPGGVGLAADLIAAFDRIAPSLVERAASHMLAWPKIFGFDAVLVPAVIELRDRSDGEESKAAMRLREACLDHLQARIELVLSRLQIGGAAAWLRAAANTARNSTPSLPIPAAEPGRSKRQRQNAAISSQQSGKTAAILIWQRKDAAVRTDLSAPRTRPVMKGGRGSGRPILRNLDRLKSRKPEHER